MAYTFVLEKDNSLFASHKEVIMQREKLVNDIWFLVNPEYNENDMSLFSVMLEYVLPCSKHYHTLDLVQDQEGYEEYLKYVVPLDTNLSSEPGDIELQLTFIYVGLDADGNGVQKVRKTKTAKLHITPLTAWSDIIPDAALSAIDQRLIKADAQMKALEEAHRLLNESKADNLKYDDENSTLQLLSGDKEIGDKVAIKSCAGNVDEEGVPVVDFNNLSESSGGDSSEDGDVIEF